MNRLERHPDREPHNEVTRRISDISSKFDLGELSVDEPDLRRDYENAINCLLQCESLIGTLQEQLVYKDRRIATLERTAGPLSSGRLKEQLAAKDEEIERLEEKLVRMSLDLASTKAREEELRHRLQGSFASNSSIDEAPPHARYRPKSDRRRTMDCGPKASFTTATTASTAASRKTSFASIESARQSWGLDESNAPKFSFGNLFSRNRSLKDCQPTQDASKEKGEPENAGRSFLQRCSFHREDPRAPGAEKEEGEREARNDLELRRPRTQRRTELGKSSKSFLEHRGVVFPVSSFEVISKGCVDRDASQSHKAAGGVQGTKNEEWPEFQ